MSGELFRRYPGHVVMAWSMTLGTVPLVLWAAPALVRTSWSSLSAAAWAALVFSALGPVFVGYWIWNWAIARPGLAHASLYLFLDIVVTGVLARFGATRWLALSGAAFLAGLAMFCGSLYWLAFTGTSAGIVAPAGGTAFIAGWVLLAAHALAGGRG